MHNCNQKILQKNNKNIDVLHKKSILYFSRNRIKCENTSISMCARESKSPPKKKVTPSHETLKTVISRNDMNDVGVKLSLVYRNWSMHLASSTLEE